MIGIFPGRSVKPQGVNRIPFMKRAESIRHFRVVGWTDHQYSFSSRGILYFRNRVEVIGPPDGFKGKGIYGTGFGLQNDSREGGTDSSGIVQDV